MALSAIDDVSINTLIGPGSFFKGDLRVNGFVRIDGDIDGCLDTPGRVIIGENARIRGDIRAKQITVGGIVLGDIIAPEGVLILSSALVLASVITKRLHVEESVVLNGSCFAIDDQKAFDEALRNYNNKKALDGSLASAGLGRT